MTEVWGLRKLRWLGQLKGPEAELVRETSVKRVFEAGSLVFSPTLEPKHVYVLESGLVRIFRVSAAGDEVSFGYVHPGEVFGEPAAFAEPRESFAQAVVASAVWSLSLEPFIALLRSQPEATFEVARQIEGRFKRIESRVEDLALRDSFSRLGRLLLQLSDEFGEPHTGGIAIECALTQSDLATFVGATRQTINQVLSRMREDGLVSRKDDRIWVLRPEDLRRRLEGPADKEPREPY